MAARSDRIHPGLSEGTVFWVHHHRCKCGELFPMRVFVAIDTKEDADLAARAAKGNDGRDLNASTCPGCGESCTAEEPYSYHDSQFEILLLVLPHSHRHRELEERAALLLALAAQEAPVPAYAVNFAVVYGPQELRAHLQELASQETAPVDAAQRREAVTRGQLAEVTKRQQSLDERLGDLQRLTSELDARSSQLTDRELGLRDRKSALDRRSQELEKKADALTEARETLRVKSKSGLPAVLKEDETQALSAGDILTSAPDPTEIGPVKIPPRASVSGSSVGFTPRSPLDDLVDEGKSEPISFDGIATEPSPSSDSELATDEQLQLNDPVRSIDSGADGHIVATETPSDPEIVSWCKRKGEALKLLRDHDVLLIASVPTANRSELAATDIRALLQLHRMPDYPLVTLTLASKNTLAGEPGKPFSFHFDVGVSADREMLEELAKSFRFKLEVFDEGHQAVMQRRLGAPLSTNVHFVVALALDTLRDMPAAERSFSRAIEDFAKPHHDRLGRRHPLAKEFKDSQLDKLSNANEVLAALALCERFSASEGEEYLVAIRSYPFERWHQRRLAVILKAIELGLWMGPSLARVAVSEGVVRSPRELVLRCQNHFATFVSQGAKGLAIKAVDGNWASLEQQAKNLGIGGNSTTSDGEPLTLSDALTAHSDEDLLAHLGTPKLRLPAIAELSRRQLKSAVAPVSRVLAQLGASEAPEAFASFVKFGSAGTQSLLVFLDCPTPHLRHAAALSLCELRDDAGVDSISEALTTEPSSLWREYALALGQVGAAAIMPVVARVARKGEMEQARAVWALAYIAGQGGRKSVETPSRGKDESVAKVAQSALELERGLRAGTMGTERDPAQSVFSEAFYSCLAGVARAASSAEISGHAVQLDESDMLEASDA